MMADVNNKEPIENLIPSLAQNHYLLFNKEFDASTCGEAMTFILERNFMTDDKRPDAIRLIINSPGGDVNSCLALIDIMEASRIPIYTYGFGLIASCGVVAFMAGLKGCRYITKNTSILSHQWSWASCGKEHELYARVKEFDLTKKRMMEHYKKYTKQSDTVIKKYLLPAEDVWLSAREAVKYGIADQIIESL
jgi:ATP-dependent Clp protease protease subunit